MKIFAGTTGILFHYSMPETCSWCLLIILFISGIDHAIICSFWSVCVYVFENKYTLRKMEAGQGGMKYYIIFIEWWSSISFVLGNIFISWNIIYSPWPDENISWNNRYIAPLFNENCCICCAWCQNIYLLALDNVSFSMDTLKALSVFWKHWLKFRMKKVKKRGKKIFAWRRMFYGT